MKNLGIKNLNYFILLVLFPILIFSALVVLKIIFAPEEFWVSSYLSNLKILTVGDAMINVEIASTPEKQAEGLSGRDSLPEDQGMLFVSLAKSGYPSFWMKDMKFGLDFIWIKGSKVTEITPQIKPEDYQPPRVIVPKEKIDKVLEINAGAAERLGIKIGDRVEFKQ